jgi:hypothetical protein
MALLMNSSNIPSTRTLGFWRFQTARGAVFSTNTLDLRFLIQWVNQHLLWGAFLRMTYRLDEQRVHGFDCYLPKIRVHIGMAGRFRRLIQTPYPYHKYGTGETDWRNVRPVPGSCSGWRSKAVDLPFRGADVAIYEVFKNRLA